MSSSSTSSPMERREIKVAKRRLPTKSCDSDARPVQPHQSTRKRRDSDMDISMTPVYTESPNQSGTSNTTPRPPETFFNRAPNGELLDGNAEAYKAMGYGWVNADDPNRADHSKFCAEGGFAKTKEQTKLNSLDIIEKYWPDWETKKRAPRSRSRTRSPTPEKKRY